MSRDPKDWLTIMAQFSQAPHFGIGIPSNEISHDRLSAIVGGSGLTDNCEDVGSSHARDVTCATSTANGVDADPREQRTSPAASPSLQGALQSAAWDAKGGDPRRSSVERMLL